MATTPIDKSDMFVAPKRAEETPGSAAPGAKPKSDTINQDEFLNLLVHQLQNQDPLNPMENDQFAVQLAQFSQLEQLISINGKLEGGDSMGAGSVASMASFLGHEVVVRDGEFTVTNGQASNLMVDVPAGTQSARVDIVNAQGTVIGSKELADITTGRKVVDFDGVPLPEGIHSFRVVSVDANGQFKDLEGKVSGTVEGFVLEPESALLVNGTQISLDDIIEVHTKA